MVAPRTEARHVKISLDYVVAPGSKDALKPSHNLEDVNVPKGHLSTLEELPPMAKARTI